MNRLRMILACVLVALAAAPTRADDAAEEKPKPRPPARTPVFVQGTLAEVKELGEATITLVIVPESVTNKRKDKDAAKEKEKEMAPEERTLSLDENTRVFVGAVSGEREVGGRKVRSWRFNRGSLADVKAGQKVRFQADGNRAARIDVQPPESPEAGDGL